MLTLEQAKKLNEDLWLIEKNWDGRETEWLGEFREAVANVTYLNQEQAVRYGTALLDAVCGPDWVYLIEPRVLDMPNGGTCIVGQTKACIFGNTLPNRPAYWGGYGSAVAALGIAYNDAAWGFVLGHQLSTESPRLTNAAWETLRAEWLDVIEPRQARGPRKVGAVAAEVPDGWSADPRD